MNSSRSTAVNHQPLGLMPLSNYGSFAIMRAIIAIERMLIKVKGIVSERRRYGS